MTKAKIIKRPRQLQRARRSALILLTTTTTYITSPQHLLFARAAADCNPCEGISNGYAQIPNTNCGAFAQCVGGSISQEFTCQGGLIYDISLSQCNWATSATCGPDPVCPTSITTPPTPPPVMAIPATYTPTQEGGLAGGPSSDEMDLRPSLELTAPSPPSSVGVPAFALPAPAPLAPAPAVLEPIRLEHHMAIWAHLNANKIGISNQLLRVAHRLHNIHGNNIDADELRNYAYYDFFHALRSMAEEGYAAPMADQVDAVGYPVLARRVFYLGDPSFEDAAAVGLINVAVFLSQALSESIATGSCDEINQEMVDGSLPIANSCGQYGQSYQDMHCSDEEKFMECSPYGTMEMNANPNGRPVSPFYCGPTEKYPFTGTADYISGRAPVDSPVPNRNGRTDVEGCCWWGRGTINTRGICQYGKLNYYLGARAAQEGRPSRYPQIDFCTTPQTICSMERQDSNVEWISGFFRWIDAVQSYDDGLGWNYSLKLHEFVAGGMTDGLFIHSVSSIVTQGCHEAPCPGVADTGVEMTDAAERWSYFLQVTEALGLPVKARQS